jgi:hypothetical protein
MAIMSIISRTTRWKPWPIIRLIILVILALGTGLVSILWFTSPAAEDEDADLQVGEAGDACFRYISTPWVLLTIFIVYTVVLVLTHIGGHGEHSKHAPRNLFSFKKTRPYKPVDVPMTPVTNWSEGDRTIADGNWTRIDSPPEIREPDAIAVASSGSERPEAAYDSPKEEATEHRGASHV